MGRMKLSLADPARHIPVANLMLLQHLRNLSSNRMRRPHVLRQLRVTLFQRRDHLRNHYSYSAQTAASPPLAYAARSASVGVIGMSANWK